MTCHDDFDEFPCPTLRHIAAAWAGHDDYRQEWAS